MKFKWKAPLAVLLMVGMVLAMTPGISAAAGLSVSDMSSNTATDLVTALVGPGVTVSSINLISTSTSAGTFSGGTGIIGFEEGVILSTGKAADVIGPNNSPGKSTNHGMPGDAALSALVGTNTFDATVLEFDFTPDADTIHWQYVFSSEEYNEYVGSAYNDVFAFFLNGVNVALVPGSGAIVSVNSINLGSNSSYFINNTSGALNTQMDGLTVVMTISAPVNKNIRNTIRLAIADSGDAVLDSNVFLKKGSFSTTAPPCTSAPSISLVAPMDAAVPANVNAGDTLDVQWSWLTCSGSTFDKSVTVRVRNAVTNALIAGYTYGYDITYDPGTGLYTQTFDTAKHSIPAGTQLKVMIYFNGRLRSAPLVNVN